MRALIIILSALGAAILVMSFLKSWQIRIARRAGISPETVGANYVVGALVAILVFAVGVLCWNVTAPRRTAFIRLHASKMVP